MVEYTLRCLLKCISVSLEKEESSLTVQPLDVIQKYGSEEYIGIMQGSDSHLFALALPKDHQVKFFIANNVMASMVFPLSCRVMLTFTLSNGHSGNFLDVSKKAIYLSNSSKEAPFTDPLRHSLPITDFSIKVL